MAKEYPNQDYFTGCKVRLGVRLEEYKTDALTKHAPKQAAQTLRGSGEKRSLLAAALDPTAPGGTTRYRIQPTEGGASPGGPQSQTRSADGLTFDLGSIIPHDLKLGMNGVRQADTVSAAIRHIDFPLDPRVVRSMWIEVYMGTVNEDDFHAGLSGATRLVSRGGDIPNVREPMHMLPDTYTDINGKPRTNLRFQGFVDSIESDWSEDGQALVKLECRDNTQLMLNQQMPPALTLAPNVPVDKAVAQLLANFPQFAGLSVEYRPALAPPATIPTIDSKMISPLAYKPDQGPPLAQGGAATQKLSVWDYLQDVIGSIGHSIRCDFTTVIIQMPRTMTSSSFIGRPDDPFTGRVIGGQLRTIRHFIWGRNIQTVKMKRQLTHGAPKNIEGRVYLPLRKKTLISRYPPLDQIRIMQANPGDGATEVKYDVKAGPPGLTDQKTLDAWTQAVYEAQGRAELTVSMKTRNLASYGGGNDDPDVMDMQAVDSINFLPEITDLESNTTGLVDSTMAEADRGQKFLTDHGFAAEFASAYVKAYTSSALQTVFRVKSMGFAWNVDTGIDVEIVGMNYIEVRNDKNLGDNEPKPAGGATKTVIIKQGETTSG